MAVLRIHKKQQNFVILDKTCLNDASLSWGAKGLHAYLISLPDDWKVRVADLKERATNGRDAVRGLLSELEQAGYIQKTVCRDNSSGRFGGLEYLVLEVPEVKKSDFSPATEMPVSVKNKLITPNTENPSSGDPETGNPLPENPTLININRININKLNNKTAAEHNSFAEHEAHTTHHAAAAVFISQEKNKYSTQEDSVIGMELTQNQNNRIQAMISRLGSTDNEVLFEEVKYCLLSKAHFTGCGNDFGKKLNSIRTVILRGDWQTPAAMVLRKHNEERSKLNKFEVEIREAQAEVIHFKRLLNTVKEHQRSSFEEIIKRAEHKIEYLEAQKVQEHCPKGA